MGEATTCGGTGFCPTGIVLTGAKTPENYYLTLDWPSLWCHKVGVQRYAGSSCYGDAPTVELDLSHSSRVGS